MPEGVDRQHLITHATGLPSSKPDLRSRMHAEDRAVRQANQIRSATKHIEHSLHPRGEVT